MAASQNNPENSPAHDAYSNSQPTDPTSLGQDTSRTLALWMGVLVAGMTLAALSANHLHRNRTRYESAAERTAVGDNTLFPLKGGPALRFEGEPLVPGGEPEPMPESRMRLAGVAEGVPYRLYIPEERSGANGNTGGPSWWVKTGPGQFLRMGR